MDPTFDSFKNYRAGSTGIGKHGLDSGMHGRFKILFSLIKGPLSLMNACTALLGYSAGLHIQGSAFSGTDYSTGFLVFLSVFILSSGAAALNNYQDRFIDAGMRRTKLRPIPQKRIAPGHVLIGALILIVLSVLVLATISGSPYAEAVAIAALVLYNGLYTPLKEKTLFAFIPGLLSGALPPVIGWTVSGAAVSSTALLYIISVLILWQMPHYWLLLLSDAPDNAGRTLPSFYSHFSGKRLACLSFCWIGSFSLVILLLPVFLAKVSGSIPYQAILPVITTGYALSLVLISIHVLRKKLAERIRVYYLLYNGASFLFTLTLSVYFLTESFWGR